MKHHTTALAFHETFIIGLFCLAYALQPANLSEDER
jgi:hypothetical protein